MFLRIFSSCLLYIFIFCEINSIWCLISICEDIFFHNLGLYKGCFSSVVRLLGERSIFCYVNGYVFYYLHIWPLLSCGFAVNDLARWIFVFTLYNWFILTITKAQPFKMVALVVCIEEYAGLYWKACILVSTGWRISKATFQNYAIKLCVKQLELCCYVCGEVVNSSPVTFILLDKNVLLYVLTHLYPPLRSTLALRETAFIGIMGETRVSPLNPSESIVLSNHYRLWGV